MNRADRRRRAKAAAGRPQSIADLRARIVAARLPGVPQAVTDQARRLLLVYLDSADGQGQSLAQVTTALARGEAAAGVAGIELSQQIASGQGIASRAACGEGCAFCCILKGADGGTITEAEARRLHGALAPLAGAPDGRAWHADACAALDPATRMCRAYDARPMICRSYMSVEVAACEAIAEGTPAPGTGVMGAQFTYLTAHALARAALKGVAVAPTYGLAAIARAAVEGATVEAALKAARHPSSALQKEQRRLTAGHAQTL